MGLPEVGCSLCLQELTNQRRHYIGFCIKREVSVIEYVDLGLRYILPIALRLAEIE